MKKLFIIALLPLLAFCQTPAKLNIAPRPEGWVLFVSGGTSNVQYEVWTSSDFNVVSTNWYYWRHVESRDFLSKPEYGEVLVYGTNTSYRSRSFYQIRGVVQQKQFIPLETK